MTQILKNALLGSTFIAGAFAASLHTLQQETSYQDNTTFPTTTYSPSTTLEQTGLSTTASVMIGVGCFLSMGLGCKLTAFLCYQCGSRTSDEDSEVLSLESR